MVDKRRAVMRGAGILALGIIGTRVLGLYRLALPRLMGAEGVGLFHMAYPVYAAVVAISTGGLPLAISKLVAEAEARGEGADARRIFYLSVGMFLPVGLLGALLLWFGAPLGTGWLSLDPRAVTALRAVAPAVFLVCIVAPWRGYFQGLQEMAPVALSQIAEQAWRVAALVALVWWLKPRGIGAMAAGAAFAAVVGALAALMVLWTKDRRVRVAFRVRSVFHWRAVARRLIALAVPLTLAGLVVPTWQFIDLIQVPAALVRRGVPLHQATALYGMLSGYATPLAMAPMLFTGSMATALMPHLSAALAQGDRANARAQLSDALSGVLWIMAPCVVGLMTLSTVLAQVLFGSAASGPALYAMAPGALGMGLCQVLAVALQANDHFVWPLIHYALALLLMAVWTPYAVAQQGIAGAAWVAAAAFGCAALLMAVQVWRQYGATRRLWDSLLKSLTLSIGMGLLVRYGQQTHLWPSGLPGIASAVLVGALTYGLSALIVGGATVRGIFGTRLPRASVIAHLFTWKKVR